MKLPFLHAGRISSFALLVGLAACSADPNAAPVASADPPAANKPAPLAKDAAPVEKKALTETKFGAPITSGDPTTLASLVAAPTKFAGQTVKTEGVVKAVCKSAGCWMEIGDESGRAHIKMAGHSFYVPKNCDGHRAVVQGKVKEGAPQNECGSKDSCGGEDNGALAKLEIEATGVEFLD